MFMKGFPGIVIKTCESLNIIDVESDIRYTNRYLYIFRKIISKGPNLALNASPLRR